MKMSVKHKLSNARSEKKTNDDVFTLICWILYEIDLNYKANKSFSYSTIVNDRTEGKKHFIFAK